MNKNTRKQVLNILFVLVLFVMMIIIVSNSTKELNFENIRDFFQNANWTYLILAFICWMVFVSFEGLSLLIILRRLGYKVKKRSALAYSTSDIYYSAITPSATGGQPASAFYMIRDGIDGGTSSFSLVFNLIGYTIAIIILGIVALVFGFNTFVSLNGFTIALIVLGVITQITLLIFLILCMCKHELVRRFGHFVIKLLSKIKIIRKREKWENKIDNVINKYKDCSEEVKKHKNYLLPVIICNVIQRSAQVLITAFVCKASVDCNIFDVFILQSLILLGYNSIPLPGGSVAYEYLYLSVFGLYFDEAFIAITMMISRMISYYISLVICGIYTMIYHLIKKNKEQVKEEIGETYEN